MIATACNQNIAKLIHIFKILRYQTQLVKYRVLNRRQAVTVSIIFKFIITSPQINIVLKSDSHIFNSHVGYRKAPLVKYLHILWLFVK